MNQTIIDAINSKTTLAFRYSNEKRIVEPHWYGRDTKGHDALRAYQIGKGWRMFHISEITGLALGNSGFTQPRPDYARGDKSMDQIYAQL